MCMISRLVPLMFGLLLLPAAAQTMTTVTMTSFSDSAQVLMPQGNLCAVPTDQNDVVTPFRIGTSGNASAVKVCRPMLAGAIVGTLQLANPALTHPSGISYRFVITDTNSHQVTTDRKSTRLNSS